MNDRVIAGAWLFGVCPTLVMGRNRSRRICRARYAIFAALRQQGMSYAKIGALTGRDHSTVIHGIKRAKKMTESDPVFARKLKRLAVSQSEISRIVNEKGSEENGE